MTQRHPAASQRYVVHVEGQSCAGKSTIIRKICDHDSNFSSVVRSLEYGVSDPTQYLHMKHDERKFALAAASKTRITLIDRGYVSTLVYSLVRGETDSRFDPTPVLRWYLESIRRNFAPPDAYVFVDTPIEVCRQRARLQRSHSSHNVWLHHPERVAHWYKHLFAGVEQHIPLIVVDGTGGSDAAGLEVISRLGELGWESEFQAP